MKCKNGGRVIEREWNWKEKEGTERREEKARIGLRS